MTSKPSSVMLSRFLGSQGGVSDRLSMHDPAPNHDAGSEEYQNSIRDLEGAAIGIAQTEPFFDSSCGIESLRRDMDKELEVILSESSHRKIKDQGCASSVASKKGAGGATAANQQTSKFATIAK